MNPVEITQGKSFKGLSQYLLHDEKLEGEQARDTSERVGWKQTFNLANPDPEDAWRLMLATANSANALKEAAGIKKGKKAVKVVHHYSINFNPDDEITPEIMQKAVEESLAVYGMSHHQALAVEHTDKGHRHVHVMVNLIDPENGVSAATPQVIEGSEHPKTGKPKKESKLSFGQKKLSRWAQKFERENGLIVTEGRLANANKRQQGQKVDARRKKRNVYDRDKREETTDRRRDFIKRQHNDRARDIQKRSDELKAQSSLEWDALKEAYGQEKDAIKAQMSPSMKARSAEIKAQFKPEWAQLFKRHEHERRVFDSDDATMIGKIIHGVAAFRHLMKEGEAGKGMLAAFMKEERRAILLLQHDRERQVLGKKVGAEIAAEMKQMKADFDGQFTQARERFLRNCTTLKTSQDESWTEIREAWREYNNARSAAFAQNQSRTTDMNRRQQYSRGRGRDPS